MAETISSGSTGTTVIPDTTSTSGPSGNQNANSTPNTAATVPNGATSSDWTTSLPEASKAYVSQKGFKDPSAVLDSYQNLEKLMGAPQERILRLPEKADAPEWSGIYDKLGRPKEASGYKIAGPEGANKNPEFTEWAQKQFHTLGLTKAQGETLAAKWNEYAMGDVKKQSEQYATNLKTEDAALHREWGAAYDQQLKVCDKAAKAFGLGKEEVSKLETALGYSATLKFLASIGSKLSEDAFVTGENDGGGFKGALTPDQARSQIEELKKDKEFIRQYNSGDRTAFNKMQNLHKFAYPDLPQDG